MDYNDFIINSDDISSTEKIFECVSKIATHIKSGTTVAPIIFSKNIKNINPLFFILLFAEKRKRKIKYAIDITMLGKFQQHSVQHILRQRLDLKLLGLETKEKRNFSEIFSEPNIYKRIDLYHSKKVVKDTLFVTEDASRYAISFDIHKTGGYSQLPIMALRKLGYLAPRYGDRVPPVDLSTKEKRKIYYSRVALQDKNLLDLKEYQKYLKYTTEDFLKFIELDEKNLDEPLGIILYELIDNIRKHTDKDTDGFFSFYRTQIDKDNDNYEYQIVIADNGIEGLLNKYLQELKKEFKRLNKLGIEKNLLKDYICTIYYLKKHNQEIDKKILNELYSLSKITHTHQIPRVAMHFGIPMLLKMIDVFVENDDDKNNNKNNNKNILEIYTHRDNNYYKLAYNESGKFIEPKKQNHSIKGTYIILTFTSRISPYSDKFLNEERNINSSIKSQDYKKIFKKRKEIKNKIDKFEVININDIEDFQKKETVSKNIIINTQKNFKNTFSEFIRALYQYTYKHNIVDIVVININFTDFFSHLKLLAYILYNDIDKPYDNPRNILFYNESFPSSAFIGGKTKNEFLSIARTLTSYYGTNSYLDIFSKEDLKSKKDTEQKIESNLIYDSFVLPFELFELTDENLEKINLLQLMLNSYLNKIASKDDIHVDTGAGYHINKLMEFKKVFEDSRWVKRLAFRLSKYFPNPKTEKYYLYGTDKYTNMLISLCHTFLGIKTFDDFKYKLFNIHDDNEFDKLDKELENNKNTEYQKFLISSVIFNAKKITKLAEKYNIATISAIRLIICDEQPNNIISLVDVENNGKLFKIEDKYCTFCDSDRKKPLLELSKSDPFFIQDTFFEPQQKKKIVSFCNSKNIQIKWINSIHFGHIERGSNHFLYYINTIKFFNENRGKIEQNFLPWVKDFLSNDNPEINEYNKNKRENIILFTSSHDTNNNFIALVNQKVFDNEAIVLSSNILRGEANFHNIQYYQHFDWKKTKIFFVDDSIASTHTLKYFYQLYRTITGKEAGLDGIIIMIDRVSSYDEIILQQYLSNKKIENIFAFATFNVKPIKTDTEKCFLCTRRDKYIELAKNSALDLTTFQMARRAHKLKNIDYKEIRSSEDKSLIEKFKTYLKAMATDYIYQNYAHKNEINESFDDLLQRFTNKIYKNLIEEYENFKSYDKNLLKKIITFQSEIALLKALSFPKLSYYYNIRKWAVFTILSKLKTESEKTIKKDFSLVYILKDDIERLNSIKKEDKFLNFYKNMTNLHLINLYFSLLGYFRDSKILNTENLLFYYKITQNEEARNIKYNKSHSLLHVYPFAVKFTIDNNIEKARYLENSLNNISEFIGYLFNEKNKKFDYINALKIENTVYWEDYLTKQIIKNDKKNIENIFQNLYKIEVLEEKIKKIKEFFSLFFNDHKVHLFISPKATIEQKEYQNYLKVSVKKLVDILNSFTNIHNYPKEMRESVQKIFYGAVIDDHNKDNIALEKITDDNIKNKIDDTWANECTDNYIVIRLTSIDTKLLFQNNKDIKNNDPVWFRPIGCIVIEKNNPDFKFYLNVTRTILTIKKYIVKFIQNEFSYGVIQETIKKVEVKQELEEKQSDIIKNINHSIKDYIDISYKIKKHGTKNITYDDIAIYIKGLKYMSSIALIEKKDKDKKTKLVNILFETNGTEKDFVKEIKEFIKVAHKFSNTFWKKVDVDTFTVTFNKKCSFSLPINSDKMRYFVFEFIFNALKSNAVDVKKPKIILELYDNGFSISNTISNKFLQNSIDTINDNSSQRQGMKRIKQVLKNNNYKMKAIKDNNILKILINKEENK